MRAVARHRQESLMLRRFPRFRPDRIETTSGRETPARSAQAFEPLRPAPRRNVTVGFLLGPFIWLVALVVLAFVLRERDAVEIGLLIALIALILGLAFLAPQYAFRVRRERKWKA
jgi:hypothetical protein